MNNLLELRVLGAPTVRINLHDVDIPARKALALLVILAMDGPQTRESLATLLWDRPRDLALLSLRSALHILKRALGDHGDLIVNERDKVALAPGSYWVDAQQIEFATTSTLLSFGAGRFLEGFDVRYSPSWDDWVHEWDFKIETAHNARAEHLACQALQQGRYTEAENLARCLLSWNPYSEQGVILLTRALVTDGRSAAAHLTLRDFHARFVKEFGTEPDLPSLHDSPAPPTTPATVVLSTTAKPNHARAVTPPFVGRGQELLQIHNALKDGSVVLLSGPAGIGKTRMRYEYTSAHPEQQQLVFTGNPTDANIPYAVITRHLRKLLQAEPTLSLPNWVRLELANLLPELSEHALPLVSNHDRDVLRLYDAITEVVRSRLKHGGLIWQEDAHHWDRESFQALHYAYCNTLENGTNIDFVITYRDDELSTNHLDTSGMAGRYSNTDVLHLGPLSLDDARELTRHLDATLASSTINDIYRFTGGNPQALIETVRHLKYHGGSAAPAEVSLLAPNVKAVITQRLQRLCPEARRITGLVAIAGHSFTYEMATTVLGLTDWQLSHALEELYERKILTGTNLCDEATASTALELTPTGVRDLLKRRIVQFQHDSPSLEINP